LRLLTGQRAEMAALQRVLEAAPAYFQAVTGAPPGRAAAQSTFTALPPDKTYGDKFVWGLYAGESMIGCADVIRGYPVREKAVIGLLLLAEPWQRHGLGRAFAALVALTFWRRLGYRETGEVKPPQPGIVADVHVFEKPLRRDPTT
jgi:GNAT superfamily N-acetyltransferase